MMHYPAAKYPIILALLITSLSLYCGIGDPNQQNDVSRYPRKYCVLSSEELLAPQQAYTRLNNNQLYTTQLDSFGYIDRKSYFWRGYAEDICPSDTALMITRSKEAVLKFSKFTYVTDTTLLKVRFSDGFANESGQCGGQPQIVYRGWGIHFYNQVYEQLEVLDTSIQVALHSEGVYWIGGHWYPEIIIPDGESVSSRKAKDLIIGTELTVPSMGGEPQVFIVEENDFNNTEVKVVLPFLVNDCIELRVVWQIGIDFGSISSAWYIYVDVITGEIVRIRTLFVS